MLPRRRKRESIATRERPQIRSQAHLRWIRGFECAIGYCRTGARIEAAHVRAGTDGGVGMKPSDEWTIPLCAEHHCEQHAIGEGPFERKYEINMKKIAAALAARSPYLKSKDGAI